MMMYQCGFTGCNKCATLVWDVDGEGNCACMGQYEKSVSSSQFCCELKTVLKKNNLFLINLFILLIYFWLHWVFVAARGLSLVVMSGGYSSLQCTGFSLQWLLLLWSTGSRCAGFSSCGVQAQ